MIHANELRVGNYVKGISLGLIHKIDLHFFNEAYDDETMLDYYSPIQLTADILSSCGFHQHPHFTIQDNWFKNIGRDRVISIACVGTPNEMVFLNEEVPPEVKKYNCSKKL